MQLMVLKESIKNYFCNNCGKKEGRNCIYGEYDYWGEFECIHPDSDKLECPCYETFCKNCYEKYLKENNNGKNTKNISK